MTLLIYDCDGVLVDSELLACEGLSELMTALGRPTTTDECVRAFVGRSRADVLMRAEQMLGRAIPADLGAQSGNRLLERFRRELKPVPGVADAITALPY